MEDTMNRTLQSAHEPIAIVGMACRFPKGLEDLASLVQALKQRTSAIDDVPKDRWTADRYFSPNNGAKGKAYIRRGGFLQQDVSQFDAAFFGISPRDAENMDPQQRLLLEVVWEAFENAGLPLPEYAGKQVGVYVGGFMLDHMITQMTPSNRSQINQNTAAGMMMTMLSNRISHTYDLRGPSLSIDTACSSSLVAFHYACQDLWRGDCEMAIVGGSNVMLRPEYPMGMCKGHFLARDGECKSFDERGDGYGRGEGAAALLLKPLRAAIANGDPILATVLGTGANQDGHTPGISMPSGPAQRALIQSVCEKYAIDPASIDYVECHGTGTAIGDPTEAEAIGSTYGKARNGAGPVIIGSVKTNIGHLEAAAGVAGLIKAVLTLVHRQAFPLANLRTPNPNIPFAELGLRLADDNLPLGNGSHPLRVAVNSFGYGGTNAHAVLESAPLRNEDNVVSMGSARNGTHRKFPRFLPISARSEKAVQTLAARYRDLLRQEVALDDLLYSASLKRAHLSHRAVVQGTCREDLVQALDALATNHDSQQVVKGVQPYQGHRKPVLVFTGMGPQWWGMGQELYQFNPIYRTAVDEADKLFREISGFSILEQMLKDESCSRIHETEFAQPGNLMVQLGLLAVLKAAGVEPGAVVGHSVGELGSAYAAGVLSLKDVLTVCYHRSQLQATCRGTGAMMAVGLSKEDAARLIEGDASVAIAAVNGPTNITLAGDADRLADLATELQAAGKFCKKLEVEVPYHSPMMDPILDSLCHALETIQAQSPVLPLYSTVTGQRVHAVAYDAEYWPLNVRQSVEFASAITALLQDGFCTFVEVGPHPVLSSSMRDCIRQVGKECRLISTLRRNQPEIENVHRAIMSIYAEGCDLNWAKHNGSGKFIALPNYAWQRDRFWLENERAVQDRIAPIVHPMLGIQEAPGTPAWRNDFDHEPMQYLRDHVVTGMPILPAAGYIESLLELATIQFPESVGWCIRDFEIRSPMIIQHDRGLDAVTSYEPLHQTAVIRALENGRLGPGKIHIVAKLSGLAKCTSANFDLSELQSQIAGELDVDAFYRSLDRMGLSYGPAFQTVRQLRLSSDRQRTLARIELRSDLNLDNEQYRMHPTMLDACFQILTSLVGETDSVYLPTGMAELTLLTEKLPTAVWCLGEKVASTGKHVDCDLSLFDMQGNLVAKIRALRSTAASKRDRIDQFGDKVKRQILQYNWSYAENLNEPKRLGHWLVVGSDHPLGTEVVNRLESYGAHVSAQVQLGSEWKREGTQVQVRSGSVSDAARVLTEAGDLDGIVFLNGLAATAASNDPTGEAAFHDIVTFSQALLGMESERRPRVYVVTQRAVAIGDKDAPVQPSQTALNGLVRVAFNELDGFQFSTVDIPSRLHDSVLESLVLELLCDAPHDEVALRGTMRLTSEMLESRVLTEDRVAYAYLNDDHPVKLRPLVPDTESVGTARVLAVQLPSLGENSVKIRVEKSIVPTSLLLDSSVDERETPMIEFVGTVLEVGNRVQDLRPSLRVCGMARADIASHIVVDRNDLRVTALDDRAEATKLLGCLGLVARAEQIASQIEFDNHAKALIVESPIGLALADALRRRGVSVTLLTDDPASMDDPSWKDGARYSVCPVGIERATKEQTGSSGYSILVANLPAWQSSFSLGMLRTDATIVDTDGGMQSGVLPYHVRTLIRTDDRSLMRSSDRFEEALRKTVDLFMADEIQSSPILEVSLADIAWQKLPLADRTTTLVVSYETDGKDLPVVQNCQWSISSESTYLITGGFGGFGQKTAEWLVAHGARHLVLTGRTGADTEERKSFVERLQRQGVNVCVAACDTSDLPGLTRLFHELQATMPPLKGVFHSGAVIIDQPIAEMDRATASKVMRSKALGAWNLHLLTAEMKLDHFVMYSSIANLVGNSRQSAYSAANGFLNGLAWLRRSMGLPATSVNWGAISDVGVVAQDEKLEQFLRYTGLRGMTSSEGLSLLGEALGRDVTQLGITLITSWADWARFETRGSRSPRFATLIANDTVKKDSSIRDALVEELSKLNQADQVELLGQLIAEVIASVLKSDPASIPLDCSINQLGVDSLMATEIQLLLDTKLGLSISILELIGESTVRSIANQSLRTLVGESVSLTPSMASA